MGTGAGRGSVGQHSMESALGWFTGAKDTM